VQLSTELVAILAELSPRERAVLTLHDVLHWDIADIAELLDITVEAATGSLLRARAISRR
jgi:DNA-directed RNA polymerase specialized sigma24 family protein